jgi:hypothetical protein
VAGEGLSGVKRRTVQWTYTVIDESDDDDVEFTDASSPSFLTELDEDDVDGDVPDQPDPIIIGFKPSNNKEP